MLLFIHSLTLNDFHYVFSLSRSLALFLALFAHTVSSIDLFKVNCIKAGRHVDERAHSIIAETVLGIKVWLFRHVLHILLDLFIKVELTRQGI